MTPSHANQGCVLPTHFNVPLNESVLTKFEIQSLTYALCHFYFNWAGSIKVPAPCQYAHKIAEFYMTITDIEKKISKKAIKETNAQQKATIQKKIVDQQDPLNNKLHFL